MMQVTDSVRASFEWRHVSRVLYEGDVAVVERRLTHTTSWP